MCSDKLWVAPELLRQRQDDTGNGSQAGDVYSFGIIMQELLFRALPFFLDRDAPQGTYTPRDDPYFTYEYRP